MTPRCPWPARLLPVAGLVLVAAAPGAWADAGPSPQPPWLAPTLGLSSPADATAALRRPFDAALPARLSKAVGGQLVLLAHCADWIERRADIVGSDSDASWRVLRAETVRCALLERLVQAQPARSSWLPPARAPLLDTRAWPGALWVAPSPDEAERIAQPGVTLRQASGVARWTAAAPRTLQLRRGDWTVRLTELARADFDGDGVEDVALQWQADTRAGSWADARLVLLTRSRAGGPMQELAPPR